MRTLVIDVPPNEYHDGAANVIRFANSVTSPAVVAPCKIKLAEDLRGKRLRLKSFQYKLNGDSVSTVVPYFLLEMKFNNQQVSSNDVAMLRSYEQFSPTPTSLALGHCNLMVLPYSTYNNNQHINWGTVDCPASGAINLDIRVFNQIMGANTSYDTVAFEYLVLWFDIIE